MTEIEEKMQLIEKLGILLEEDIKLSPIAARIYALLIVSDYDGLTFEEIRSFIDISKSSMSININLLLQLDYISSYTKTGIRKRYFKLAKYSALVSLNAHNQEIATEIQLITQINNFNKKYHPQKYNNELSLGEILNDYLNKKQRLVQETIKKINDFSSNEQQN